MQGNNRETGVAHKRKAFKCVSREGPLRGAGEPGKSVLVKEEFRWTLKDNGRGGEKNNRSEQGCLGGGSN